MPQKERSEIPAEVAARVLFLSDRTCCVCRVHRKPVQIHHIDEDPGNSGEENLAVLCVECHRDTQIRGGFDRKLDAHQILLYRQDWYVRVARKRRESEGPGAVQQVGRGVPLGVTEILMQDRRVHLSYLKWSEKEEEHSYSFDADYPQITPDESSNSRETNLCIAALVTRTLQRFRAEAIARSGEKKEMRRQSPGSQLVWDDLSVSHNIWLFDDNLLTVEFNLVGYFALAVHPNSHTKTLNFLLRPSSVPLEFRDLFRPDSGYSNSSPNTASPTYMLNCHPD